MSKIQKWNIKDGEHFISQDIQSVLGQNAKLSLLYQDGYAGAIYLNKTDNSIWEEIYIWENGEKDVTTVKLSYTSFHEGRITFVSTIIPHGDNLCEVRFNYFKEDLRKDTARKGYEVVRKAPHHFDAIWTDKENLDTCLLHLNELSIPFGEDKSVCSPMCHMRLLQQNGLLTTEFLEIYWMCDEFTITIKNEGQMKR